MQYAGFWQRFVAYFIDSLVLSIPILITIFLFADPIMYYDMATQTTIEYYHPLWNLFSFVVVWLYAALMESSKWQGTLGKMCLGLRVVDLEGNRISFLRATGRYFSKILSALIFMVGYMMAGWTKKKQALHDKIVDTLVIRK